MERLPAEALVLCMLLLSDFAGEGDAAPSRGGKRYVSTRPEESPTARMGAVGWIAWAKMSARRLMLQMLSNIVDVGGGRGELA